jgi:hypothetical protein
MYNIFANIPAVILATQDISFAAAGLNATNTRILYKIGAVTQSWIPGSTINPLTGFEYNQGYIIDPIADIDLQGVVQTKICAEENGGTGPIINAVELVPVYATPAANAPFILNTELINRSLYSFERDGIGQMIVTTGTTATITSKQVLYNQSEGKIYPPDSNPFSGEDIKYVYKKVYA